MQTQKLKSTNLQKGCYKLWQRQMAENLNDAGYTIKKAIETGRIKLDVPWTEFTFEQIFTAAYMDVMYPDAKSISDLSTDQINTLYESVNNGVAQAFAVSLPFPSEETLKESKKK